MLGALTGMPGDVKGMHWTFGIYHKSNHLLEVCNASSFPDDPIVTSPPSRLTLGLQQSSKSAVPHPARHR